MELYFSPLACSLSCRIALYEAGLPASYTPVTLASKRTGDDRDYFAVNPKGQVPALRLDDDRLVTEVPAVLQVIAAMAPDSGLMPAPGTPARDEALTWLNYVATEVHKLVFYNLFSPETPDESKAFARKMLDKKLDHLNRHLDGRETLVDGGFTVADAYLITALNWCRAIELDLAPWPHVAAYQARHEQRPAVAKAMREELALWQTAA